LRDLIAETDRLLGYMIGKLTVSDYWLLILQVLHSLGLRNTRPAFGKLPQALSTVRVSLGQMGRTGGKG
jgi:hypothetical protein